MKNNHFLVVLLFLPFFMLGQESKIDPAAIQILDNMNDLIGELKSCSYDLSSSLDIMDPEHGLIKSFRESNVILVGPDKAYVSISGDGGNRHGFWYNGSVVNYYSYAENNYATIEAPDNIIATIDSIHMKYDLEIPAADFFYPSFTDDILEAFETIEFLGVKVVDGKKCFHLKSANDEMEVQYWIASDAYFLPTRYLIMYKNKANMQYQATFSNWKVNTDVPNAVFEFSPPPEAKEIKILAKNESPK
jgi:hypothetical protein